MYLSAEMALATAPVLHPVHKSEFNRIQWHFINLGRILHISGSRQTHLLQNSIFRHFYSNCVTWSEWVCLLPIVKIRQFFGGQHVSVFLFDYSGTSKLVLFFGAQRNRELNLLLHISISRSPKSSYYHLPPPPFPPTEPSCWWWFICPKPPWLLLVTFTLSPI